MKNWKIYLLSVIVAFCLAAAGLNAATITKGLIGKEDINLTQTDNAAVETFTRATSTGGTLVLTKLSGGSFPWDNTYTRTIRPLHIVGSVTTSTITNWLSATITNITSSGTASLGTLTVSGTATVSGAHSAASYSGASLTTTDNVTIGGHIVGDAATIAYGIAQYQLDGKKIDSGTAAPTTGTWAAGDIVINSAPTTKATIAATAAVLWRCITGGTPGTWQAVFPTFAGAPDNATAYGVAGMVAMASGQAYFAVADNTWQRAAIATW